MLSSLDPDAWNDWSVRILMSEKGQRFSRL